VPFDDQDAAVKIGILRQPICNSRTDDRAAYNNDVIMVAAGCVIRSRCHLLVLPVPGRGKSATVSGDGQVIPIIRLGRGLNLFTITLRIILWPIAQMGSHMVVPEQAVVIRYTIDNGMFNAWCI